MLISEILPSWNGWPRRNRSTICTNNYNEAHDYYLKYSSYDKTILAVIPENDAKLTICPTFDMWSSFNNLSINKFTKNLAFFLAFFNSLKKNNITIEDLKQSSNIFNNFNEDNVKEAANLDSNVLETLFEYIENFVKTLNEEDLQLVSRTLYNIVEWVHASYQASITTSISFADLINIIYNGKKIINIFDKELDPNENDFELQYYSTNDYISAAEYRYDNREIWTESTVLVFDLKEFMSNTLLIDELLTELNYLLYTK